MIKIDYEGAWKELKEKLPMVANLYKEPTINDWVRCAIESIKDKMNDIEKKHTHDYADIVRELIEFDNFIRNKIKELSNNTDNRRGE